MSNELGFVQTHISSLGKFINCTLSDNCNSHDSAALLFKELRVRNCTNQSAIGTILRMFWSIMTSSIGEEWVS